MCDVRRTMFDVLCATLRPLREYKNHQGLKHRTSHIVRRTLIRLRRIQLHLHQFRQRLKHLQHFHFVT